MTGPSPRVFTIPASAPFLRTLTRALLDGGLIAGFPAGGDPLALARATIYLPTRRACRLARDVFLAETGGRATLLPRIVPLGLIDEEEIAFSNAALDAGGGLDIPDALGGFEREMLLTELVLKWANTEGMRDARLVANTPAAALKLAKDLAHLMDDMATRQVAWSKLDTLVPDRFDTYWDLTLRFLKIARDVWPAILQDHKRLEPAERQNRLIAAEAERLKRSGAPVIAAGSTGSIPATATLLETIARLPNGAVVLPGLDTSLDGASWDAIGAEESAPSHPQFAMQALLRRFGIARDAVTELAEPDSREVLASEAMRPAGFSDRWNVNLTRLAPQIDAAMNDIAVIEAASAEEEALAIAIALRGAAETPGTTAALITPDRALARRVLAALARWNIEADDSAGDDLADTPEGLFARLVADAALSGLAPVPLLAMLKHPLCRLDRHGVEALEFAVLRGARPAAGIEGLRLALANFRKRLSGGLYRLDPRQRLSTRDLAAADRVVDALEAALAAFAALKPGPQPFAAFSEAHRQTVTALAGQLDAVGPVFDQIAEHGTLAVARDDYAELFHAAIANRPVRRLPPDARVRVFGTLESRLQNVDCAVLGGLAEGVWPPEIRGDPWLSRPMRQQLGLDLPERRIGLSAHDFTQALGAQRVILSRAARVAGAPTVPSRFVQRLAAVAGKARWERARKDGDVYLQYARQIDEPETSLRIQMPEPKPAVALRPTQLSVTEIEHWLRDPYTIYAKHVLKLLPLDAVDTPPGARDRGTVIHGAIGQFVEAYPDAMPEHALQRLLEFGERSFAIYNDIPEAVAFWWPRFQRIAGWFVTDFEPKRREAADAFLIERSIKLPIALPNGSTFTLTARADRVERLKTGDYTVLDFKTGKPPKEKQVRTGLAPQLTLEAAMLRQGAMEGIARGANIAELVYVALRGGEPPGEAERLDFKEGDPNSQADMALKRLTQNAARFTEFETPYPPLAHPMWSTHYGDYDHLARVKEWALTDGSDEDIP
jgi:ATP-dependent helicase/nuclease subunit B